MNDRSIIISEAGAGQPDREFVSCLYRGAAFAPGFSPRRESALTIEDVRVAGIVAALRETFPGRTFRVCAVLSAPAPAVSMTDVLASIDAFEASATAW